MGFRFVVVAAIFALWAAVSGTPVRALIDMRTQVVMSRPCAAFDIAARALVECLRPADARAMAAFACSEWCHPDIAARCQAGKTRPFMRLEWAILCAPDGVLPGVPSPPSVRFVRYSPVVRYFAIHARSASCQPVPRPFSRR